MIFKKKAKITLKQLGEVLFVFAWRSAKFGWEDKQLLEQLAVEKADMPHIRREMIIIYLFIVIITIKGVFRNETYEMEALKQMHLAYFEYLEKTLNFNNEEIRLEHSHIYSREQEYEDAMAEKRGPSWVFPLADCMLNNLKREKVKDAHANFFLSVRLTETMKGLQKVIGPLIKIVKT